MSDDSKAMGIKTYVDPDLLKIREIDKVKKELFELNGTRAKEALGLLIEYRNILTMGICPNLVRKYKNKMNAMLISRGNITMDLESICQKLQ